MSNTSDAEKPPIRAEQRPSFGPWLTAAANRLHHNVLATALANKLARIAWTVLMQARSYEARV
jgi:transposase